MLWLTVIFLCSLILHPSSLGDLIFGPRFCGHAYDGCAEGKRPLLAHANDVEMLLTRSLFEMTARVGTFAHESMQEDYSSAVLSESIPLTPHYDLSQ
jgi:hypothetical protein